MAKIEDWFVPSVDVRPFGGLAGFMLYVAAVYLLGPFWQEFSEYMVLIGVFTMGGALLVAYALPRKPRFKRATQISALVGLAGAGLAMGSSMHISDNLVLAASIFFALPLLFAFIFSLMVWMHRTQEVTRIYADGDFSLELIRELAGRVERLLSENSLDYRKDGNGFRLDMGKKRRIAISVDATKVSGTTEYKAVLRTNGSRELPTYLLMRAGISGIIQDIEQERGIDSFPKVKRIVCGKCGRNASYLVLTGQFFCRKCGKYKEEKDVNIISV